MDELYVIGLVPGHLKQDEKCGDKLSVDEN